jgi:hypothetical protein
MHELSHLYCSVLNYAPTYVSDLGPSSGGLVHKSYYLNYMFYKNYQFVHQLV